MITAEQIRITPCPQNKFSIELYFANDEALGQLICDFIDYLMVAKYADEEVDCELCEKLKNETVALVNFIYRGFH